MSRRRDAKLCSADEAVAAIASGATVVSGGFVGAAHAEALSAALERRFLETGTPRDLTLVFGAGQGDGGRRGLNHVAHAGLVKRVVGGHWGLVPALGKLAVENRIEAYNFPQGAICQLIRDIAAGRPGCVTHVGLGTFVDPLHGGGRINARTTEPLVERIELGGRTWLWYKSFPVNVGLIRATAADSNGGLVMDEEAVVGESLAIAQGVRNHGGIVIAQVRKLLDHAAPPQNVRVPGILVDRIVLAEAGEHDQTFAESFNSEYCSASIDGDLTGHLTRRNASGQSVPLDERSIIASRACDELRHGSIANLGIGMPEGIARVAAIRGLLDTCTLTIESGPIGGIPAGGLSFGASSYPESIIDQPAQFDFYDGGGLDYAALGAAQIDRSGNVNVSRFGDRLAGIGGFANIANNARTVVFCGTFTTSGLKVTCRNGTLQILNEGHVRKFPQTVEQIGFAADRRFHRAEKVLYITERAVFGLSAEGIELLEIAPGIDVETQILPLMDFRPVIREVRPMPPHCFLPVDPRIEGAI